MHAAVIGGCSAWSKGPADGDALRLLEVGPAYAVWTGIGAAASGKHGAGHRLHIQPVLTAIIRDAIGTITDDWAFRFPGIADGEHVYFYAATSATPDRVQQYFRRAYQLGLDFERPTAIAARSAPAA